MNKVNRRSFLWLAGAVGAAPPVAAALDLAGQPSARQPADRGDLYTFRAVAALPNQPLPAYASYVVTGHVDTRTGLGMLTQTVFAGGPSAMSEIALPGLSRSMRVTGVEQVGDSLHVTGMVDDRSQLRPGECPAVEVRIDRARRTVMTEFLGSPTQLNLVG
jgi:hypothetical protein